MGTHDTIFLTQRLADGNVCAFVGAGLSVGAGLPDWYTLLSELANEIDYALPPREWTTSETLINAAQAYINAQGLQRLISLLKERLDTFDKAPTTAHLALARLPITLVFTANYDDLLERAYRQVGKRVEVIVNDHTIPFMRRTHDSVNIVKLYGDLNQPETIVLARQQYEAFFLNRPQMVKLLETELARSDMLYLGWSHTDPHFNLTFGELLQRFGTFIRPSYAIMFDVTATEAQELQRKQIRLVQLPTAPDRTQQIATWLESLQPGHKPTPITPSRASPKGDDEQLPPQPDKEIRKRWAVLVGVNEYEDHFNYGRLHVCVKDSEAVRDQLLSGGYAATHIRLLADHTSEEPRRAKILTALQAVADATEPDDLLLFYYSGHGDEMAGESYLVGKDGHHLTLADTAVSIRRIKAILETAPARAKVIILDACHAGADLGGKAPQPMTAEFIRRVFAEAEGIAILASCKQAQLSYEWRAQERSVFTHFLLEALTGDADREGKGMVTVQDASRHVTNGVKEWASQRNVSQTPTLHYTGAGDIPLVRLKAD